MVHSFCAVLVAWTTAVCVAYCVVQPASAQDADETDARPPVSLEPAAIIPLTALFGDPAISQPRISGDGGMVGFLAVRDGVLNVWVQEVRDLALVGLPRAVSASTSAPVERWTFVPGGESIVYFIDERGDEQPRAFVADITTGATRSLTPESGVRAELLAVDRDHPHELLLRVTRRDGGRAEAGKRDVWRFNSRTGIGRIEFEDNERYLEILVDASWNIRLVSRMNDDGSVDVQVRARNDAPWAPFRSWTAQDASNSGLRGMSRDGATVYLVDSGRPETRNTGGLWSVTAQPEGGGQLWRVLAASSRSEPHDVLFDETGRPICVSFLYERQWLKCMDVPMSQDLLVLRKLAAGEMRFDSSTDDGAILLVTYEFDQRPAERWLYRRRASNVASIAAPNAASNPAAGSAQEVSPSIEGATRLFDADPALRDQPLVRKSVCSIAARDGQVLTGYLSVPRGIDPQHPSPVPLVVLLHDGPWSRDGWTLDLTHQWLANRGYAVLAVNPRGSSGLGARFMSQANRAWQGTPVDDAIDAARAIATEGFTALGRMAVMGNGAGGYTALMALAREPELFACGLVFGAPIDLRSMLLSLPSAEEARRPMYEIRVGRVDDDALVHASLFSQIAQFARPVFLAHGTNDVRAPYADAERFARELSARGTPIVFRRVDGQGHALTSAQHRVEFFRSAERFLAQHLGGATESSPPLAPP
ncbi:MAG: prolyl oligopeptidase family serine peptidase [Phycisphaerae bacterium]|nr:prolyl oligopeptidase family serine peptidase [Phycisphaerae bacterium]